MGDLYLGHSANHGGRPEPLREHLEAVSQRAGEFASAWEAADQAMAAGLLHDLGKYSDRFLRRVAGDSTCPAGDHATVGAMVLLQLLRDHGLLPAACVLGHHGGLPILEDQWQSWLGALKKCLLDPAASFTETDIGPMIQRFQTDGFKLPERKGNLIPQGYDADDMLDTRMLFSALVDADFLETEAHFEGDADTPRRYRPEGPPLEPEKALSVVRAHIDRLRGNVAAGDAMQSVRDALQGACESAAEFPPGLFTLAAPTGSGKTLAMLLLALKHAVTHNLRRIVLVMPYLNIIDQTARLYRQLFSPEAGFPDGYIIEDHSLACPPFGGTGEGTDDDESNRLHRLLAENWDAPIVLTTSVRCLESLMAHRPGACRKLHRLAGSVLLFDEVQTLPRHLAVATLGTLSRLSARYRASVVFATATQPAFEHLADPVREIASSGWQPRAIVEPDRQKDMFFETSERTQVFWEHQEPVSLDALADRLADETSTSWLCILNLKRHARELFERLKDRGIPGLFHLSTSMCPLHREQTLELIRTRLDRPMDGPVRLVSTQCVEAGVDLDFAVVYRAMAPLEAIAQAAGRCNRHGRQGQPGRVYVFKLDSDNRPLLPPGAYAEAASVAEAYVNDQLKRGRRPGELIHAPERIARYYRDLYDLTGTGRAGDKKVHDLHAAMRSANFEEVSRLYRLIDSDTINILVGHDEPTFDRLRAQILSDQPRRPGFLREWIRQARPLTVALYRPSQDDPLLQHIEPVHFARFHPGDRPDWYLALPGLDYHPNVGLKQPQGWQGIV